MDDDPKVRQAMAWFESMEKKRSRGWKTRLCARLLRMAVDGLSGPPGGEAMRVVTWAADVLAAADDGAVADGLEATWAASDSPHVDLRQVSMARLAIHYMAGHLLQKPTDGHGVAPWARSVLYSMSAMPRGTSFEALYAMADQEEA